MVYKYTTEMTAQNVKICHCSFQKHPVSVQWKSCNVTFARKVLGVATSDVTFLRLRLHFDQWAGENSTSNITFQLQQFVAPFQTTRWYSWKFLHWNSKILACIWKIISWIKEQFSLEYHVVCNWKQIAQASSSRWVFFASASQQLLDSRQLFFTVNRVDAKITPAPFVRSEPSKAWGARLRQPSMLAYSGIIFSFV